MAANRPGQPPGNGARMPVTIEYFTDILCIWAWGGQVRLDQLRQDLGEDLQLRYRFIPLFAAARQRVHEQWDEQGGFKGFNCHLGEVARQWDHVTLSPAVWLKTSPPSSTGAHLMLKAVQLLEARGEISARPDPALAGRSCFEECTWRLREAFFHHGENVSERAVQENIAGQLGLPVATLRTLIDNGEAHAALHLDDEAKHHYRVPGSPTMVLNEGRQLLYGNVGYRIIEANVRELLHNPHHGEASWC